VVHFPLDDQRQLLRVEFHERPALRLREDGDGAESDGERAEPAVQWR
jgi:hypothetical protein